MWTGEIVEHTEERSSGTTYRYFGVLQACGVLVDLSPFGNALPEPWDFVDWAVRVAGLSMAVGLHSPAEGELPPDVLGAGGDRFLDVGDEDAPG